MTKEKALKLAEAVFIVLVLFAAAFPIFYKLGIDNTNVDQFLWLARSNNFYNAITTFNFKETYQQYHPGVTLMYLITFGQKTFGIITGDFSSYENISPEKFPLYNFWTKFYVALAIYMLLVISFFYLKKLVGLLISTFFLLFLVIEPYYLGNIRNLHLDALLSMLLFSSFIVFIYAIVKNSKRNIYFSGVLSGLAFLTKAPSFFILPLVFFSLLAYTLIAKKGFKFFGNTLRNYLFISIITFFVLFPAMWVAPTTTLEKVISEGVLDTGVKGGHTHYVNGKRLRNPGFWYYRESFKYRVNGYSLALFFIGVFSLPFSVFLFRKDFKNENFLAYFCISFSLAFMVVLSLLGKKTDRYMTPIYPFFIFVSSYGLLKLSNVFKKFTKPKNLSFFMFVLLAFFAFQYKIAELKYVFPDMFAYYSASFGGISAAKKEIYLNQGGTGMIKVADFLKSQNVTETTKIGLFDSTTLKPWINADVQGLNVSNIGLYDYVIIPIQRGDEFKKNYNRVYTVKISGVDYWKIYKKKDTKAANKPVLSDNIDNKEN